VTVTVTVISLSTAEGYMEGSRPAAHPASKAGGGFGRGGRHLNPLRGNAGA
jgi:hypothetical protein